MDRLASVLGAIGPNASIIFAVRIFMGSLQQRYDGAVTSNPKRQALLYRRRCKLMAWAILIGLVVAILLISSWLDALDAIVPNIAIMTTSRTRAAIASFALIEATIVVVEGLAVSQQIDDELRDVPNRAEGICQRANKGWWHPALS